MPKNILAIDDEAEFLNMISMRLNAVGYNVITARDGKEGLEKARNMKPDLILLDILMPKLDGYEVCRLLKFDEKYKDVHIIMLTARTQDVDREMAKKVCATDYITKPFKFQELVDKIKKLIGE